MEREIGQVDRRLSSSQLAGELHVDPQTIRYHARRGRIPFDLTPGRQRRFDLGEVRAALAAQPITASLSFGGEQLDYGISVDGPELGGLSDTAEMLFSATAGYDETRFGQRPAGRLARFAVPGTAKYPRAASPAL